jgi:hypothetical protein
MSEIDVPTGLGLAGEDLWNRLHDQVEFEAHELKLVEEACRVADVIAQLEAASEGQSLVVKGSTGQPVISPLISEARFQRGLLANLLTKLKVPLSEDREAELAEGRSQRARKAVLTRHGKVVA